MIVSNPTLLTAEAPAIDISEARWAVEYLSLMIARLDADSPVRIMLTHARRELASLAQSATAHVVGPIRIAA